MFQNIFLRDSTAILKLTSRNLSRLLLLPEFKMLCCNGVKVLFPDCGVQKLEVLDWAWTVLSADLLSRMSLVSASGTWTSPPCYKQHKARRSLRLSDTIVISTWTNSATLKTNFTINHFRQKTAALLESEINCLMLFLNCWPQNCQYHRCFSLIAHRIPYLLVNQKKPQCSVYCHMYVSPSHVDISLICQLSAIRNSS